MFGDKHTQFYIFQQAGTGDHTELFTLADLEILYLDVVHLQSRKLIFNSAAMLRVKVLLVKGNAVFPLRFEAVSRALFGNIYIRIWSRL